MDVACQWAGHTTAGTRFVPRQLHGLRIHCITNFLVSVCWLQARCKKAIEQVDFVLAQWHAQMQALTLSESNAEVLAEGVVSHIQDMLDQVLCPALCLVPWFQH